MPYGITWQSWESCLYPQLKQVLDLVTVKGCKAKLTYVSWKRTGWELNPWPISCKSNTLLQRHHATKGPMQCMSQYVLLCLQLEGAVIIQLLVSRLTVQHRCVMFWHHCLHCRLIKYPSLIMITFCKDFQSFDWTKFHSLTAAISIIPAMRLTGLDSISLHVACNQWHHRIGNIGGHTLWL